jgi:hypothetical protein
MVGTVDPSAAVRRNAPPLDHPPPKCGSTQEGRMTICTWTKKNGKPCGMINTLPVILDNGQVTARCRHHRDGLTIVGTTNVGQPMPTSKFKSRADAERFTQWVLEQGGRGHINAAQVNALMKAVSQWNKLRERLEQELYDDFMALVERAHKEHARLEEIADSEEGLD